MTDMKHGYEREEVNWYVALAERTAVVERRPAVRGRFDLPQRDMPPQTVMERLDAIGVRVFYPKIRQVRQRLCKATQAPIRDTVWVSPFGRYVFAATDEGPAAIAAVRGVAMLLLDADGNPGVVPAAKIDEMRRLYRNYKQIIKAQTFALKPGQTVKIIDGPFRGYDAEVENVKKLCQGMFRAVADVMNMKVPIDIPVECVEPVEDVEAV